MLAGWWRSTKTNGQKPSRRVGLPQRCTCRGVHVVAFSNRKTKHVHQHT